MIAPYTSCQTDSKHAATIAIKKKKKLQGAVHSIQRSRPSVFPHLRRNLRVATPQHQHTPRTRSTHVQVQVHRHSRIPEKPVVAFPFLEITRLPPANSGQSTPWSSNFQLEGQEAGVQEGLSDRVGSGAQVAVCRWRLIVVRFTTWWVGELATYFLDNSCVTMVGWCEGVTY